MYFKIKKLVIAVGCALPALAVAQTSVQVYGKLYPYVNRAELYGATAPGASVSTLTPAVTAPAAADVKNTVMDSANSRLGFRGTENIGKNLKALFQLEAQLNVDDGQVNRSRFWSRNTFVGLAGGFGTVKFGRMDTVYKEIGDNLSFLGISSGTFVSNAGILSKAGFGDTAASFHLRNDNTIHYASPRVQGLQGLISYSLGEQPGATSAGAVISGGLTYSNGPLYLALAHERHNDFFGASRNIARSLSNYDRTNRRGLPGTDSTDKATRLTAKYRFGATEVGGNIARLEYDESGGASGQFASYSANRWSVGAKHKIGPTTLQVSYAQADEGSCSRVGGTACSTRGLDGRQLNIGASYDLSKRTYLYAIASQLRNGESAVFANTSSRVGDPEVGQDIRQVALGVSHSF